MKNYSFLLAALLFATATMAQKRTVYAGRIINPKGTVVKLETWDGYEIQYQAKLDATGRFKFVLNPTGPLLYFMSHGDEQTSSYLTPGDSLYVTLDTKQFDETIRYGGTAAAENKYLAQRLLDMENTLESKGFMQEYYKQIALRDATGFSLYADSVAQLKLDYLDKHKQDMSAVFYDIQHAEIVYGSLNDKANYPTLHFYLQGIQDSAVDVGESYFDFYNQYEVNEERYLPSSGFMTYLDNYIRYVTKKQLDRDSISTLDRMKLAKEKLKGRVYEKALVEGVLRSISYETQNNVEAIYALAKSEVHDTAAMRQITLKYQAAASLFPGNPAPAIVLKNKEGKEVQLSDFKGKLVYLDFWASWCGPCMMEVPAAKILQDTFAGKDIVFLYVSLDEVEKDWLNAITAKKMKGIHVRAGGGFDSQVAKAYTIQGIPTYYLIGRDGKIILKDAPRPSDSEIISILDKALRK